MANKDTVLSIIVEARNKADQALGAVRDNLDGIRKSNENLLASMAQIGKVGTVAFGGLVAVAVKSTNDFGEFEQSIQKAGANINATKEELSQFREVAKQVGIETNFSAKEAAEALFYLAGGSIDAKEAQAGLYEAAKLAASGELSLQDAVLAAGDAMTQFGVEADQAGRISDAFIYSTTRVQQTMPELTQAFKQVASTARQAGLSFEETTGFINLFADSGKRGMEGGIALANILKNLTTDVVPEYGTSVQDLTKKKGALSKQVEATKDKLELLEVRMKSASDKALPALKTQYKQTQEKLRDLNTELTSTPDKVSKATVEMSDKAKVLQSLGIQVFDTKGKIRDMVEIVTELADKFQDMTDAEKFANAELIFGSRSARDFLTVVQQGSGALEDYIKNVQGSAGVASEFTKRLDEARTPMEIINSTLEVLNITLGSHLMETMKGFAERIADLALKLSSWMDANPELTDQIFKVALGITAIMAAMWPLSQMLPALILTFKGLGAVMAFVATGPGLALVFAVAGILFALHALMEGGFNTKRGWQEAWIGIQLITFEIINSIIAKFEDMMNYIVDGVNGLINKVNALISKMAGIPGLGKTIGKLKIDQIEKFDFKGIDTDKFVTDSFNKLDKAPVVNNVTVSGNVLLDEKVAEQIGDKIMSQLKFSNAI